MRGRITAYLMLSIALAATVFCYTLLQGIAGSRIAGASPQRRYFTLGVEMGRSVDYALSAGLAAALQRHLPHAVPGRGATLAEADSCTLRLARITGCDK